MPDEVKPSRSVVSGAEQARVGKETRKGERICDRDQRRKKVTACERQQRWPSQDRELGEQQRRGERSLTKSMVWNAAMKAADRGSWIDPNGAVATNAASMIRTIASAMLRCLGVGGRLARRDCWGIDLPPIESLTVLRDS